MSDVLDLNINAMAEELMDTDGVNEIEDLKEAEAARKEHLAKLSEYLRNLTPEQRAAMREKAEETRRRKKEFADTHYRQDWMDDKTWRKLAKLAGVHLSAHTVAPTPYNLAKFAKQIELGENWKEGLFGVNASKGVGHSIRWEFDRAVAGQRYNLRAYQGTMLEMKYGAAYRSLLTDDMDDDDEDDDAFVNE